MKKAITIILLIVVAFSFQLKAQESTFKKFKKLSCPEKRWVIFHPFIAKKALKISNETLVVIKTVKNDRQLDGDANGGQIDAFRHAYWMARLTQEINWRKARKLGKAHEKGNKRYFKKNKLEDGTVPDQISCEMDLKNNEVGISIGKQNKDTEAERILFLIKKAILEGKLYKIKKDSKGNFLNIDGNVLKEEDYKGFWINNKCIVASDFK